MEQINENTHIKMNIQNYPFVFTYNYFDEWKEDLLDFFNKINVNIINKNVENVHVLEFGCYQGKTSIWFLENILTHESSSLTVVDTFLGSTTQTPTQCMHLQQLFTHNITPFVNKVHVYKESVYDFYKNVCCANNSVYMNKYDYIFIDTEINNKDALTNAIYAKDLVKCGGFIIFPHYLPLVQTMPLTKEDNVFDASCDGILSIKNNTNKICERPNIFRGLNIFIDIWKDEFLVIMQSKLLILQKI